MQDAQLCFNSLSYPFFTLQILLQFAGFPF